MNIITTSRTMALAAILIALAIPSFSQPVKNTRAILKAKDATASEAASLYYYYLDERIPLQEVEGLRVWAFSSPEAAKAAAQSLGAATPAASRQTAAQTATKAAGPAVNRRGNLASFGYLIMDEGDGQSAQSLSAAAATHKVKAEMPAYMSRFTAERHKAMVIPPQILAKWKAGTAAADIAALEAANALTLIEEQLGDVMLYSVAQGAAQPSATIAAANALVESGLVQFAHPNFIYQIDRMERSPRGSAAADLEAYLQYARISTADLNTNDTYINDQWHLNNRGFNTLGQAGVPGADISATRAWNFMGSPINNGIKAAVVDDGLDTAHEDMQGNILPGRNYMTSPANDNVTPDNPDSHGCATSGLVGAVGDNSKGVAGVAHRTDTKIMHVRIFDQFGATTDANIGLGLRWAVDNGADLLSNSWGGGSPSSNITDAVTHANTNGRGGKGAPCLFATGNEYLPLSYPAWLDNAISVGGTTDQDQHVLYANFGPDIDIVAPTYDGDFGTPGIPEFERTGIWTIDHSGSKGYNSGSTSNGDAAGNYYKWFSGTSAATPIAAGVAALIIQKDPNLTWQQVRSRLRHTADKVPTRSTYNDDGFSPFFGYGRVNALQAINDFTPEPANYGLRKKVIFDDDFNGGNIGWTAQAPWAIANISGRNVWTESPGGDYINNMNTNLQSPVIDLSNSRGSTLEIVINHEIEVTPDLSGFDTPWDFLYIEASKDGSSWTMLKLLTGDTRKGSTTTREYVTQRYDISAFDFEPSVLIRFRFTSDESVTYDGVQIDRVRIFSTGDSLDNHFSVGDATGRPVWIRNGRELAYPYGSDINSRTLVQGRLGFPILDGTSNTIINISTASARNDMFYILESAGLYSVERIGWDSENRATVIAGSANARRNIAINPAGTKICWVEGGNIMMANANGSSVETLVDAAARSITDPDNPTFSRNGLRVYFDAETAPGNRDLYVIDANNTNFRKLTDTPGINESQPDPDALERRLAFAWLDQPGNHNISMITNLPDNRVGSAAVVAPLITSHIDESAPRWSTRGDLLAYLRGDGKIWVAGSLVMGTSHPEIDEFYPFNGSTAEEIVDGWVSGGVQPFFPLPNFTNSSDAIGIEAAEFASFGFWLSPGEFMPENTSDLIFTRFNYSTGLAPCDVPQIRSRAIAQNQNQGVVMGINSSVTCNSMPIGAARIYDVPFQANAGSAGQNFRASFDMANFDPFDAVGGFVFLHDAEIWQMSATALGAGRAEKTYTFDATEEGWLSGSNAPILSAPIFAYAGGQLAMTAVTSIDTFGFWQSPGDITIETGRMYQMTFNIEKDTRAEADNTVVRVRAFTGDNQAYVYQEQPLRALGAGPTVSIPLYFVAPYPAAGVKLQVAIDLLNFDPATPTDAFVKLDSVNIVSHELPIQ